MADLVEELSPFEKVKRAELERAFRSVIATVAGKRVLFWLLEQCAIYRDADCGENTHATAGMLGEQRVGRNLINQMDLIDPRFYPQLLMDIAEIKEADRALANSLAAKQENDDHEE